MYEQSRHLLVRETHGMEHDWPIYSVSRYENVLADDMGLAGPELVKIRQARILVGEVAGKGDIVQKSVEPNIGHVIRIERELDAPRQSLLWPGNAEIARKPLDCID